MRHFWLILGIAVCANTAVADILVPTRTIRPNTLLVAEDFAAQPGDMRGVLSDLSQVEGMEARVALYPGRPVRLDDVGPPALVERNAMVSLIYESGGLQIVAVGRALGRGASGDMIKVMNLASRTTLVGSVQDDGSVIVGEIK